MADNNNNGGIFGNKGFNNEGDSFKNLANEVNNAANTIPASLDKIQRRINEFRDELDKQKLSLNIDPVSSQKIEKVLSDLESDFTRLMSPMKDRIQREISDLFSSDIKTDNVSKELTGFSDLLSDFAKKINQLSAEIGVNLGSAFENLNKETVESLRSFSEILAQLQQKDLKINNPFPEIIESLDEIAKREQSISSFNSVLSNILNVPVEQGTAYHLLELSDSLEMFNKTMSGTTDESVGKLSAYIDELERLSEKSKVFNDIAENIKSLSIVGDITKQVNELTTALSGLAHASQGVPSQIIPAQQNMPSPTVPQAPSYGPHPHSYTGGSMPSSPANVYNVQNSSRATIPGDRNFDNLEQALARLQLNNMSGAAWFDQASHKISDGEVSSLKDAVEEFKNAAVEMKKHQNAFNAEQSRQGTASYNPNAAEQHLKNMNASRQKMQDANSVLVSGVTATPRELKNSPEEFLAAKKYIENLQDTVKQSMTDQFKLNEAFGLDDLNDEIVKANRNMNDMVRNMENQPWDRVSNKINSVMKPLKDGLGAMKGGLTGGLNLLGLGSLGSALSIGGIAGGVTGIYQSQGRLLADAGQAELLGGYDYDRQNVRDILKEGREYQEKTNGRIQQEEYLKSYTALVNNVRGQYGGDKGEAAADMRTLTSTATVMKGMGVSDGATMQAITTYYKELGLSANETEYQLAKVAQTAQSLNVPFEEHLKAVTGLAMQYKQIGISADEAANMMGNLMFKGEMTQTEASRFAGNVGNSLIGGHEGWLAYGAGMMGMDPFSSIVDLKYGYNDDGTLKDGVAEKRAEILSNNYRMMSGLGGSAGEIGMIKALEAQGITDPRDVAKFLNNADNPSYLVDLFKDVDSRTNTGGLTENNAKEYFTGVGENGDLSGGVLGQLSEAADQLSGIDKTLNAYDLVLKDLVGKQRETLDNLTDFSGYVEKFGGVLDGLFDGFTDLLNWLKGITGMDIATLFGIGAIAAPLAGMMAGGALKWGGKKLFGGGKGGGKYTGGGSPGGGGGRGGGGGGAKSPQPTPPKGGTPKPSWLKNITKTKGGKLAIAGAAAAGGYMLYDHLFGSTAEGAPAGITGPSGSGGSTLDDIHSVLLGIYDLLGGKLTPGTASATGLSANDILAASQGFEMDGATAGLMAMAGVGLTESAAKKIAGKTSGAKHPLAKATVTDIASHPKYKSNFTTAKPQWASNVGKNLMKGVKSNALTATAFGVGMAGYDMYNADKLNEIYGIDNGKDMANIAGTAGFSTAATIGGAAIGQMLIPIPVLGAAVGGVAGGWLGDMLGDTVMGWFGAGDADVKRQKQQSSPIYNEAQAFMERHSGVSESMAAQAAKGMYNNSALLGTMSRNEKDAWGAEYARAISEGKSEEQARQQANELFKLNNTNEAIKELNSEQLATGLDLAIISGTYQKDFETYHKSYTTDTEAAHKILEKTKEQTGQTTETLKELYGITETQPEKIAIALAAAIAASGLVKKDEAGNMTGDLKFDDPGKAEELRKSFANSGVKDVKKSEQMLAAYMNHAPSLNKHLKNEAERNYWLEAYVDSENFVGPRNDGLTHEERANQALNNLRKNGTVFKEGMGNLFDGLSDNKFIGKYLNAGKNSSLGNMLSGIEMGKGEVNIKDNATFSNDRYAYSQKQANKVAEQEEAERIKEFEEQMKILQENNSLLEETHKESEKTKEKQHSDTTENDIKIGNEITAVEMSNHRSLVDALTTLQNFIGDNAKNIWNKLQDINLGVTDAVQALQNMSLGGGGQLAGFGGAAGTLSGNGNAEKIWNFFAEKGFGAEAISGIMGNLQQESGLSPTALNPNGAFGVGQWMGGRKAALSNYAQSSGKDVNALETQLEWMWQELNGADPTTKSVLNKNGGLDALKGMGVEDAARLFEKAFERSGGSELGKRIGYAQDFYAKYGSSGAGFSNLSGGSADVASHYLSNYGITTKFSPGVPINDGWHDKGHNGIDLSKPGNSDLGDPIYNITGGKVSQVMKNHKEAGNGIVVAGADGREYRYIHMQSTPNFKVGDTVNAGDILGKLGSTGRSSGAHLDLKIKENGEYIDPEAFLKALSTGGGASLGSYAGHNTGWYDSSNSIANMAASSLGMGSDDVKAAIKDTAESTKKIADSSKDIAENTNTSKNTVSSYAALTTNIAQNDPYAGIKIKSNMQNSKYVFDMYDKLDYKGIDYNDQGVNMQKFQQNARKQFDVNMKVDFNDPTNSPNFQRILDRNMKAAFNAALEEVKKEYSSNHVSDAQNQWLMGDLVQSIQDSKYNGR